MLLKNAGVRFDLSLRSRKKFDTAATEVTGV
jgi:hypothetical protein